jgi:hypothetical protein
MRDVALKVPLGFFSVVRRRQRGHTAHPRVQALGDALDHAPFAGRVPAFKQDHHAVAGFDHPVLQHHQLGLQAQQFAEVKRATTHGRIVGSAFTAPAVIQFQLQFLVHAVEQVFSQLAKLFFSDRVVRTHNLPKCCQNISV